MSSDLQSVLELLQMNNYLSLVSVVVVTYDYFLTFSREIQYVWCRPWTWVSTMFVLLRYFGLTWTILDGLIGTIFIPGPVVTYACTAVIWVIQVTGLIFLNIADVVMILRVYAMWNRSKRILWLLLFSFVPQITVSIIFAAVINPNEHLSVTTPKILAFSVCSASGNTPLMLNVYYDIPRFVLGAMLLILAVTQTLKQSIAMYTATKQWQPNRYMERLVRDGILYFSVNMYYIITSTVGGNNIRSYFLSTLCGITLCPMVARFIISVRELYDRDSRRGLQGVDTGFGVLSQPNASQNAVLSAIAFADVAPGQDQVVERDASEEEPIRLEPLGDDTHRV